MKYCTCCNQEKPFSDYHKCKSKHDGVLSQCKICRNKKAGAYREKLGNDFLYKKAKDRDPIKYKEKAKEYAAKNSAKAVQRVNEYRKKNPDCRKLEYQKNKDAKIIQAKKWAEENPNRRKEISRNYAKRFYLNPKNKPYLIARKIVTRSILLARSKKQGDTCESLGYTADDLRASIESKFDEGMNWGNHGEWHVDHIKPIKYFSDIGVTDIKIINSLSNLRPLWAKDNLSKGAKYES